MTLSISLFWQVMLGVGAAVVLLACVVVGCFWLTVSNMNPNPNYRRTKREEEPVTHLLCGICHRQVHLCECDPEQGLPPVEEVRR